LCRERFLEYLMHSDDRFVMNTLLLVYAIIQNPGTSTGILEGLGLLPISCSHHGNRAGPFADALQTEPPVRERTLSFQPRPSLALSC